MKQAKYWEKYHPEALRNFQIKPERLNGSLADFATQGAQHFNQNPAFSQVLPNGLYHSLNFKEINQYADQFAYYLQQVLQLKSGDVIALQLPNCLQYPIAALAAWKVGLIVTNINPLFTAPETQHQLQDSGAKLLIACDLFIETAQVVSTTLNIKLLLCNLMDFFQSASSDSVHTSQTTDHAELPAHSFMQALSFAQNNPVLFQRIHHPIALYQYTGGTTGRSKGAILTHANLIAVLAMSEVMLGTFPDDVAPTQKDTILTALPMYHIFAFNFNFLLFFSHGRHNVLIPSPRPLANLEKAFQQFKIQWMTGVDTLLAGLLQQPWFVDHPPALKMVISGGTSLRQTTATQWREKISLIIEGYGMTESCCFVSLIPPYAMGKIGSVGIPLPGIDLRLVNDAGETVDLNQAGEIWIKGPNIFTSYLNNPAETQSALSDGWFKTGDVALMDHDGCLHIVDRKKDLILVSGFNVYPNEIENVLSLHPDIIEVAVIGITDATTGEAVKAFVISRNPDLTAQDLIQYCQQSLTNYKIPKQIEFMQELPKSNIGKILRAKLRPTAQG